MSTKDIAESIRQFAKELEAAPLIGARIDVVGVGGGPATGVSISVRSDPSGHPVTGVDIRVSSEEMGAERNAQVQTLLAAADALEEGVSKPVTRRIVEGVGRAAANAGMTVAFEKLLERLG